MHAPRSKLRGACISGECASLAALFVLAPRQGLIDELLPDRVGLPDLGHGGASGLQWHPLPQHAIEEEKGRDPHIRDTVDEPFLVFLRRQPRNIVGVKLCTVRGG